MQTLADISLFESLGCFPVYPSSCSVMNGALSRIKRFVKHPVVSVAANGAMFLAFGGLGPLDVDTSVSSSPDQKSVSTQTTGSRRVSWGLLDGTRKNISRWLLHKQRELNRESDEIKRRLSSDASLSDVERYRLIRRMDYLKGMKQQLSMLRNNAFEDNLQFPNIVPADPRYRRRRRRRDKDTQVR